MDLVGGMRMALVRARGEIGSIGRGDIMSSVERGEGTDSVGGGGCTRSLGGEEE